jgi:hypothetical protein
MMNSTKLKPHPTSEIVAYHKVKRNGVTSSSYDLFCSLDKIMILKAALLL